MIITILVNSYRRILNLKQCWADDRGTEGKRLSIKYYYYCLLMHQNEIDLFFRPELRSSRRDVKYVVMTSTTLGGTVHHAPEDVLLGFLVDFIYFSVLSVTG